MKLRLTKLTGSRVSVAVTAAVAAAVSYAHLWSVAEYAGESWRAWLLPLSADGLAISASLTALHARDQGRKIHPTTWFSLVVGLVVSVAANMLTSVLPRLDPDQQVILSAAVAAWPPIALALSFEQLLRLQGPKAAVAPATASEPTLPASEEAEPKFKDPVFETIHRWPEDKKLTGKALGLHFGKTDSWGRSKIREFEQNGHKP